MNKSETSLAFEVLNMTKDEIFVTVNKNIDKTIHRYGSDYVMKNIAGTNILCRIVDIFVSKQEIIVSIPSRATRVSPAAHTSRLFDAEDLTLHNQPLPLIEQTQYKFDDKNFLNKMYD